MAKKKAVVKRTVKAIDRRLVTLRIIGTSPLIQNHWSEKALLQLRRKHSGVKTKTRDVRNPEQEFKDAGYYTEDGKPALPCMAVKKAVIAAAHQDLGIPRALVCRSLFIFPQGRDVVVPLEKPKGKGPPEATMEEDIVRVGKDGTDLRYRPYFYEWAATLTFEFDAGMLTVDDLLIVVDRAGFGVGIQEWRPEKDGGEFGRFRLDRDFKVVEKPSPYRV